jgi:hypothetical protein
VADQDASPPAQNEPTPLSPTPTQSEIRMSETGADLPQPQDTAPDPLEGAPPLSGMDVPPSANEPGQA